MQTPMLPVMNCITTNSASPCHEKKNTDAKAPTCKAPNHTATGQSMPRSKGSLPLAFDVMISLRARAGRISNKAASPVEVDVEMPS